MVFFERYLAHLEKKYPASSCALNLKAQVHPLLLCPEAVELPIALRNQAEETVRAFWKLRNLRERKSSLENLSPSIPDPGNSSVLMSYDFHVDEKNNLRLIEINTNASMSLMCEALYEVQGIANPFVKDFGVEILACFNKEAELAGVRDLKTVAIVDENPEQQRLYVEFVFYKELFERAGLQVKILDPHQLNFAAGKLQSHDGVKIDLVYNRHTDFYFQQDSTAALKDTMLARAACISPHPHEYRLLADKERLMELSQASSFGIGTQEGQTIKTVLLECRDIRSFTSEDELWNDRKRWFFKPKRSYGGKATYRGSSISRSMFQQVLAGDYLAQEFVAAPEIAVANGDQFKFDLRFYVYQDRIQQAAARLYLGQMTNAQTPGGGMAAIKWKVPGSFC